MYNNSDSETIKKSLFFINYEKNLNLFLELCEHSVSNTVIVHAESHKRSLYQSDKINQVNKQLNNKVCKSKMKNSISAEDEK